MGRVVILGVFVADTAYRADRQPRMGETILGRGFALGPGGKGSNQSVAAARVGAETHMVTRLARDAFGGFSALVQKGHTPGDTALIRAIPEALATTERVCASVNVGSTRAGINMDAVAEMGRVVVETARLTAARDGLGCAKLVVFCNAVDDNPFMAGAFHGIGEPDCVVNVGVSGPADARFAG